MNLEVTDVEREFLLTILQARLSELKGELHHSRVASYTEQLKLMEQCLRTLIGKLESPAS